MSILISADGVVKHYGMRSVLKAGTVCAHSGQMTALLGRNGAGKSTLLKIMCGVLSSDGGNVRIDGMAKERWPLHQLARRGLFFLPDRDILHPSLRLGVQLEAATRLRGDTPARVTQLVEQLQIGHCMSLLPRTLSGGERRRAEFAFALACNPRILVADEPLRGIAPVDAELLLSVMRDHASGGSAVVITGHEINLIVPRVDRVYWCTAGTTHEYPSPLDALTDNSFRRDFLGIQDHFSSALGP